YAAKTSSITDYRNASNESSITYAANSLKLISNTRNASKPLIVDSGASHHMISDTRLITDIEPAHGNVMIAHGDKIAIKGIGNLNRCAKESNASYMPEFASNLFTDKKCTTDSHGKVLFRSTY